MFDINFYIKSHKLINDLMAKKSSISSKEAKSFFENARNKNPIIYNIETTNACNMRCKMCPRTTMMTRSIETMTKETFINIVNQIKPFKKDEWKKWTDFVLKNYRIKQNEMSENNFFLYIIPKVIQLHGYGDPLLDKNMPEFVKILTDRGFFSYFSCNPANINVEKTEEMFKNGLTYIKYSIESVDDDRFKEIRGQASNFTKSYEKILQLIELKKAKNYKTVIVITMLDLNKKNQKREYDLLKKAFRGLDVYLYLKSEDQQWYRKDLHGTNSTHWSEICKHPWMSMTIKSNGEAAMCMEDFNNEIILGNVHQNSLYEIWNGEKYKKFREDHFNLTPNLKCTERCDMKLVGKYTS